MKRKTAVILLASAMMLTMVGCSGNATEFLSEKTEATETREETKTDEGTEDKADNASSDSASADSSDVAGITAASIEDSFTYKGETFSVLDDLQTFLSKIDAVGTPTSDSPTEVKELGTHIYYYDVAGSDCDFSMYTINKNGTESIGSISLMGANVKTSNGITSGSTVEELISAYGEPTFKKNEGEYYYEADKYVTSFDVRDGKVFAIYYYVTDYYNSNVKPNL